MTSACLCAALLIAGAATAAAPAVDTPRYDLRPGDHLVFRQTLDREIRGADASSLVQVEWESHLVVVSEAGGTLHVGIQRNRKRAERVRGGSAPRFAEELERRPAVFVDAQWLTPNGQRLLPFRAVREWTSRVLPLVHELEALPDHRRAPGERWTGDAPLQLAFRAEALEKVGDEECLRAAGRNEVLALRYWFCAASGTTARVEYESTYQVPAGDVHETLKVVLQERRRGEDAGQWLADPATREATLAALLVSPAGDVRPERVYALLAAEDARLERRILALAWRKRWPPPALAILERLLRGDDARVRTLAARLLPETEDASATRERAKADADPFVRAAVERREPPKEAMRSLASAVRAGQAPPEWPCGGDAGWASRATAAQRTRGQVPGATLRMMRTPPNEGLPYVAQVPDDYRGDEPYPLVIVLGGGAGVALEAAQRMDRAFDATGYVAVYPQAIGSWWDDASAQAVLALLREVLSDFNIDANRVYLTGVSNGGTGTFLYSTLWPDRLAAAAPLMGAGVLLLGSRLPSLEGVARLPLLFVHGTDDAVIPTAGSADTVKAIRRADPDARVEMHTLSGRGHDVHVGADGDLTLPFFARHVRDPFPRTVRWRGRTLAAARAFWVEVLEKDGGNASVDATIDGHTVTLETRHVRRLRLLLRRELLPPGPLRVTLGGRVVVDGAVKEDCGRLARTWAESGDPFLAHAWEIAVTVPKDAHASQQSPPSIPRTP